MGAEELETASRSRSKWRSPACPTCGASARPHSSASRRSRSSSSRTPTTTAPGNSSPSASAQVAGQLPPGTEPPLISSLTGRLNEIFEFTLEAEPGAADLDDPARSRGVRRQQPAARRPWRGGRRTSGRLPAPVPGAARSRPDVGAAGQPRRGDARGRGVERERLGRVRRAGRDGMDGSRARPRAHGRRSAPHGRHRPR